MVLNKDTGVGQFTLHMCRFAFDTPNLSTGAAAVFTDGYVLDVNDVVLAAYLEIDTPWDGTTPVASGLVGAANTPLVGINMIGLTNPTGLASIITGGGAGGNTIGYRITAPTSIKICVSQDGTPTGGDPGSTQGAGVLYIGTVELPQ